MIAVAFGLVLYGFDSTYEGLKLLIDQGGEVGQTRFDSTYEGLKRRSVSPSFARRGAFRQYL